MTHLFDAWGAVAERLGQSSRILLMLDFDGTLAPIVSRPGDARVPEQTMATLLALQKCPNVVLAAVSGRSVRDVQRLMGLDGLHYFGSHGRERIRPGSDAVETEARGRAAIRSLCDQLSASLSDVTGFEIEDKLVSAAAHYRNAEPKEWDRIERAVRDAVDAVPELRMAGGKMVYDITPADGIDKGTAALALARETGGLPFYFGDDTTDESAFGALSPPAVTVFVGPASGATRARYRVADPGEVGEALARILSVAQA